MRLVLRLLASPTLLGAALVLVSTTTLPLYAAGADDAPPATMEAARLAEQRAIAARMKHAILWEGAHETRNELHERRARARRGHGRSASVRRGEHPRPIVEDSGPVLDDSPAVTQPRSALATVRALAAPENHRCNDPASDLDGAGQAEESVAAIGDRVVVSWNDGQGFNPPPGDGQGFGWSIDGGRTFVDGGTPPHPNGHPLFQWRGDPIVSANEKTGEFYLCGLGIIDSAHTAIAVARGRFVSGVFAMDSTFLVRAGDVAEAFLDKPWMTCDSVTGNVYITNSTFGTTADTIDFYRSTDGGRTWSPPMALSADADAGWVQSSRVVCDGDGNIATTWTAIDPTTAQNTLRFRRSTDRGLSFGAESTPVRYNDQFGTGAPGYSRWFGINDPSLAVDRTSGPHRGRVYLSWPECWRFLDTVLPPPGATNRVENELGNDVPATATAFAAGQTLSGTLSPRGSVLDDDWFRFDLAAGQSVIAFADSVSRPADWYMRLMAPGGGQRLCYGGNISGILGVDANCAYFTFTAPASGTYYLRMVETGEYTIDYRILTALGAPGTERGRDQRDVFVSWSDDGGAAWAPPVRVNDDGAGFDDFLPELCVGADGCVYAAWYDHRDETWGSKTFVYASRSTDGGGTWAPNRPVSEMQSNFTASHSNLSPNMGDYMHLTSTSTAVHSVWADGRAYDVDVWTATIPTDADIVSAPRDTLLGAPGKATLRWVLGATRPLFAGDYSVRLDDQRHWPLPAPSTVTLGTGGGTPLEGTPSTVVWSTTIAVPDTAARGANRVCLTLVSPGGVPLKQECFAIETAPGLASYDAPVLTRGWPNPARGEAHVGFSLPHAGHAKLEIYDLAGARVRTLFDGACSAGATSVTWDGRDVRGRTVRSGAYFYRLEFEGQSRSRRLVFMR